MASLIYNSANKTRHVQWTAADGTRPTIYLGKIGKRDGEGVRDHIEALAAAKANGRPVPPLTAEWAAGVGDKLHAKLAKAGLVEPRKLDPAGRRIRRRHRVTYFVRAVTGGPVKIGVAIDLGKRLCALQTGNPDELVCFGYLNGDREAKMHDKFLHLSVGGEWFRADPELLDFVRDHAIKCNLSRPPLSPEFLVFRRDEIRSGRNRHVKIQRDLNLIRQYFAERL